MNKKANLKIIIPIVVAVYLIIAAIVVVLIIYFLPSNRVSRQLELGNKYLAEQNYEQAIAAFNKAIEIDPVNTDAYIGKGSVYLEMGDFEQAIDVYETALFKIPDNDKLIDNAGQVYIDYAQTFIDNDDLQRAIEILQDGYDLLQSKHVNKKLQKAQDLYQQQFDAEVEAEEAEAEKRRKVEQEQTPPINQPHRYTILEGGRYSSDNEIYSDMILDIDNSRWDANSDNPFQRGSVIGSMNFAGSTEDPHPIIWETDGTFTSSTIYYPFKFEETYDEQSGRVVLYTIFENFEEPDIWYQHEVY